MDGKTLPKFCRHCGSSLAEVHCQHPACHWVVCTRCEGITDVSGLIGTPDDGESLA